MKNSVLQNRKAQAVLPFFALNLVALLIFFIVVLSLLSMAKNLRFTADEFNAETMSLMAQQRVLASADCFAADEREIAFTDDGKLLLGSRVYPGLVDVEKLNDIDFFNCMRKDKYDDYKEQYQDEGIWDAEEGTGASFRYAIAVFDLATNQYVHYSATDRFGNTATFSAHEINSFILRMHKQEGDPSQASDRCAGRYGSRWDVIQYCTEAQCASDSPVYPKCKVDRCEYQTGSSEEGTDIKPYYDILTPERTVFDTYLVMPSNDYRTSTWVQDDPVYVDPENPLSSYSMEYNLGCSDQETLKRTISPVMLKVGAQTHPGIFIFASCVIKGDKYDGITTLENVVITPEAGKVCD
ncbi:MAG: hypothetical protein PHH61_01900 [Candidatus Nanoarchaeia archaeon]|nr:hypothetical protein [Candidatus Paceibacterota bacterium]MDD5239194.1 hypothetical protein [Candidatus Nanoarchaeia archaeon]